MPGPTKIYPWAQQGAIPDPDTLTPDQRQELLSQPWFQRALSMHQVGVNVTPDLIEKLMQQPGAQGYQVQEQDLGDGQKAKMLVDVATGKPIQHDDLVQPDFEPKLVPQVDPKTGKQIGYAQTTSRNSAVPFKEQDEQGENPLAVGQAAPVKDENGKTIGHVINTGARNIYSPVPSNSTALLGALLGAPVQGQDDSASPSASPGQAPAAAAAGAAAPKQLNGADAAAFAWAQQNPSDPRAAKIMQGLMGGQQ